MRRQKGTNETFEADELKKGGSFFDKENAKELMADFVGEFPIAKKFLKEIVSLLNSDDELASDDNCLSKALNIILSEKIEKGFSEDNAILEEKILSRQEIKDRVVEDYLKQLAEKATPKVISDGGNAVSNAVMPSDLKDASELAKIFIMKNLEGEKLW